MKKTKYVTNSYLDLNLREQFLTFLLLNLIAFLCLCAIEHRINQSIVKSHLSLTGLINT